MRQYYLYPPFFVDEQGCDFSEGWERFCLKLLKVEYNTKNIKKRRPPESGVDLFYEEKKIAFQCKSVEENSSINISKIKDSLKSALKIKDELKWEKYVICVNGELTGNQEGQLKNIYSNIEVRDKEYWIGLCSNYSQLVEENFRILIDVPKKLAQQRIDYNTNISMIAKNYIEYSQDEAWLYSHKSGSITRIPISNKLRIYELEQYVRTILGIPRNISISTKEMITEFYLTLSNLDNYFNPREWIDDKEKTLEELGFNNNFLIELRIEFSVNGFIVGEFQFNSKETIDNEIVKWENEKFQQLKDNVEKFNKNGYC